MDAIWKTTLWRQFGAAIDMLENAIRACPDHVWGNRVGWYEYWTYASHTLFWLDYYLSDQDPNYTPPEPFTLCELDPDGVLPPRVYTRDELLDYLAYGRAKCRRVIAALTEEEMTRLSLKRPGLTAIELLLYNMRHVQHHTAQLNLLLRQKIDSAPRWVSIAAGPLEP